MESTNQVRVNIKLHFDDLLHASRLYRTSTSNTLSSDRFMGFLIFALGILILIINFVLPSDNHAGVDFSHILIGLLCLGGLSLIFDWIPAAWLWLSFQRNVHLYSQPYQVVFNEHGMSAQREHASAVYEWSFYKAAVEGSHGFILIYEKDRYYTVPKSAFQNQSDIELFRNMLKSNLASFRQIFRLPTDFLGAKTAT